MNAGRNIKAALCLILASSSACLQAFALDERSELCGYVFPVSSYEAEIDGILISLPANDRLMVNGKIIAERTLYDEDSRSPSPWEDSGNSASIAVTKNHILVKTNWSDCVDYAWSRIFVLDRSGTLIADNEVWNVHYPGDFFYEGENLMYRNEWLCEKDKGAPTGLARVHILESGAKAFVEDFRPWSKVCGERTPSSPLYFSAMRPGSTER